MGINKSLNPEDNKIGVIGYIVPLLFMAGFVIGIWRLPYLIADVVRALQ
jgi:hypothetical protein